MFNVKDVRPILSAYQGKDIPVEYAKKEAEAKRVAIEEWERRNPNAGSGGAAGWLGGVFGGVAVSDPFPLFMITRCGAAAVGPCAIANADKKARVIGGRRRD